MKTDIPLKRLTAMRGADLLPLFGFPAATLLRITTRELPMSATRLDTLLHVRSPAGQEYLQVVDWQAYRDTKVLWRLAGYVAWLGQEDPTMTVVGTVVYLHPGDDLGDSLTQIIDNQVVQRWQLACVRLWEYDANDLLARGSVGLAVLSPLAHNPNATLVEQAIERVLQQAPHPQQADLLSTLGIFAEPLIEKDRFVRLVGKERLMESQLFRSLMQDKIAELQANFQSEKATLEAQLQQEQQKLQQEQQKLQQEQQKLQQTLVETLLTRFPHAPLMLLRDIWQVQHMEHLHTLIVGVVQAADLAAFETLLKQVAAQSHNGNGQ
jgi:Skp family chaperone for outer membrane proteins